MKRNGNPKDDAGVKLPVGEQRPYIDPRVPQGALGAADAYQAGLEARNKTRLQKIQTPVAGGPGPRIPHLGSQPAQEGMTMEQHAVAADRHAQQMQQLKQAGQPAGFVEPAAQTGQPRLNLQAGDVLPEAARKDPDFRKGHGDMIAFNQPEMAVKYGVIRNGKVLPPQVLLGPTDGKPPLRDATLRDLETLAQLERSQQPKLSAEETEPSEVGEAAGRVGNVPGDDSGKPLSEAEKRQVQKNLNDMDDFEFDTLRQSMMKDILNNPEQRKIVEDRLIPMDVGDIIVKGHVMQNVPIVPDKFEVRFRSIDGETDLAIKRLIMEESKSLDMSDRYYLDKFSLMSMTALLYDINKKPFPDHLNDQGNFDDEKFREKFQIVVRMPFHMLASIGVHAMWFDERVRKLFVVEQVGNG
jgi:hypothetical protein